MKKQTLTKGSGRKFTKDYRQGYADALALYDAVLQIGEAWQPGSHPRTCQCLVCEVTGHAPDKLAESWVYQTALTYADGDRKIAHQVADCSVVQSLLDDGYYGEAIVAAARLAERAADLARDMRGESEEDGGQVDWDDGDCDE